MPPKSKKQPGPELFAIVPLESDGLDFFFSGAIFSAAAVADGSSTAWAPNTGLLVSSGL